MSGERMTDAAMADLAKQLDGIADDLKQPYCAEIRKIAAALRARPQAVAEGFVIAPIKVTREMYEAGIVHLTRPIDEDDDDRTEEEIKNARYVAIGKAVLVYGDMLAASQSATGGAT